MAQANIVGNGNSMDSSDGEKTADGTKDATPKTPVSRRKGRRRSSRPRGLKFTREITKTGVDPLDDVRMEKRTSVITNPDGSVVFRMEGAEIPAEWSQLATDIVVSKYFRKAGLFNDKNQGERSVRQVVYRIAHTIREAGERFGGYFATARRTPRPSRPSSASSWSTSTAPSTRRSGSTAASTTSTSIEGAGGNYAFNPTAKADSPDEIYETDNNVRAAAVLGLLHPRRQRRLDEHLRAHQVGSAPLQVRLRHRQQLQRHPRSSGEAERRRHQSSGFMSFLEVFDRAAGCDQEWRHHAPRRQDGLPRHGSPRDRGLHQLEGP